MAGFEAIWLGDGDPNAQIIHMGDLRFIKGEATVVADGHEYAELVRYNPLFEVTGVAGVPVEKQADKPVDDEREVVMAELDAAGIKYDGRAKLDTLRALLG